MKVTREEMQQDLDNTIRDSEALQQIIEGWRTFIFQSGGEDRSDLIPRISHAQALKDQADHLIPKIKAAMHKIDNAVAS